MRGMPEETGGEGALMTQVQAMSDPELNRALAVLMGAKVVQTHNAAEGGGAPWYRLQGGGCRGRYERIANDTWKHVPDYCTDPAASLEVQAAACKINKAAFIGNLSYVLLGKSCAYLEAVSLELAADFCMATPLQRAEAAYMTIQGARR